jgi:hypothetical protein|tara:strand:- start:193 stop:477 length:285 start_codon:yes stop_codon:yes gene_type:complete
MNLDDFDFGFSIVDENELEAVTKVESKLQETSSASASAAAEAKSIQSKMDKMYNAVIPLLNNLQKNPEKEYIYWPGRHNKVEQFRDKLTILYKS